MAIPSWETGVNMATRKFREKGLVGLASERMGATKELAGRAGEAYMKYVAEPTAGAANILAFGMPESTP